MAHDADAKAELSLQFRAQAGLVADAPSKKVSGLRIFVVKLLLGRHPKHVRDSSLIWPTVPETIQSDLICGTCVPPHGVNSLIYDAEFIRARTQGTAVSLSLFSE